MLAISWALWLLVLTTGSSGGAEASMSELRSRKIFNQELDKMAYDFQVKLQEQIVRLESEMYSEFLRSLQEIQVSQEEMSDALRATLAGQAADVMEKFAKVMAYSTVQIQQLHDELNGVLLSVGGEADAVKAAAMFSPDEFMTATLYESENTVERSRRHALEWPPDDPFPLDDSRTTINSDPATLPLEVAVDVGALLDSGEGPEGRLRDQGWSPDFVLRDYAPGLGSMASSLSRGPEEMPRDCLDLLHAGHTQDGVYTIYPSGMVGVEVWCDQTREGGGWTVVVGRRADHSKVNFTRLPLHYTRGFGHPLTQHWIGLDHLEALTRDGQSTLRAQLLDHQLNSAHATYEVFRVAGAEEQHRLEVGGYDPASTAGDALSPHSGRPFAFPSSAPPAGECEGDPGVGWWFLPSPDCYQALPTGACRPAGQHQGPGGVEWRPWRGKGYSLHALLLMTRRGRV